MSITRVDYRERQRLTTADLRAEQEYRLAAAGRHHLGPHDWGVVVGLHVSGDAGSGTIAVSPGLAIDGYGREILVLEPVFLTVDDPKQCWSVLLYLCERPEQVPPGRACQDDPAPRTRDDAVIVPVEQGSEGPLPPAGLGLARAGGQAPRLPPWPVRLARVGTACGESPGTPFVDMSRTRYVRHRAALVYGPSAATVQLGLRNREDLYHFLISTPPSARATAERRLGIDRDRDVHVWKPLWLTGSMAGNQVVYAAGQVANFATSMPAGIGRRLRLDGMISARGHVTRAVVLDQRPSAMAPLLLTKTVIDRLKPDSHLLLFGPRPIQLERLPLDRRIPLAEGPPLRARRAARVADAPLAGDFSIELAPFGGWLRLELPTPGGPSVAAPACGDIDRFRRSQGAEAPFVQWRPGGDLAADPNARELHAATVSPADAVVPHTALRISGGDEDASDASPRVAFGARNGGAWVPALQMNGGRGLQILGKDFEVKGALYLPPIGRDDPLFPELMALAFMGGLFQSGATVTTLTVTLKDEDVAPNPLKRGEPFGYTLGVKYNGTKPRLQRCIEVLSGVTPGRADVVFRPLPVTLPQISGTVTIPPSTFRHRADSVEIRVLMLLKQGTTATGVVLARSGEIRVVD